MAESKQNIYAKLLSIQAEINVPKNAFNKFGNYSYRNCESILEAIKPFLKKHKVALVVTDSIEMIGDRHYIKACARLIDAESGEFVENSAFAREPIDVKGMSPAQITGASSSYARKYALGGLLALDDNKDPDTNEYHEQQNNAPTQETKKKAAAKTDDQKNQEMAANVDKRLLPTEDNKMSKEQYDFLMSEIEKHNAQEDVINYCKKATGSEDFKSLSSSQCIVVINGLLKRDTKSA